MWKRGELIVRMYLEMERDEIQEKLPYGVICEAKEGSRWNTMRRKRRWAKEFSEQEREAAGEIFRKAHSWMLVKGVPDKVKMTLSTYSLWQKLGEFCASI